MCYSCLPNIGDIILHNKAILHNTDRKTQTVDKLCNYRNASTCLLERRCKEGQIMYKAALTLQNKSMVHYGSCETEFKSRYNNHKQKTRHRTLESNLESQRCGRNHINRVIHCQTLPPYQYSSKTCQLFLAEKVTILQAGKENLLNKRLEQVSKCRHINKFLPKKLRLKENFLALTAGILQFPISESFPHHSHITCIKTRDLLYGFLRSDAVTRIKKLNS